MEEVDTSNSEHLSQCNDDGCERCRWLINNGFYMACDYCGSWGQWESDGWVMCRGIIFCNERCRDFYFGEDASEFSETEPLYENW